MARCPNGHDHSNEEHGVFDLLDVAERLRFGKAWEEAKELGVIEERADGSWRVTKLGARLIGVGFLVGLEVVEGDLTDEKEISEWTSAVMQVLARVVLALGQQNLLSEELDEAVHQMEERKKMAVQEGDGKPPLPEWVELT